MIYELSWLNRRTHSIIIKLDFQVLNDLHGTAVTRLYLNAWIIIFTRIPHFTKRWGCAHNTSCSLPNWSVRSIRVKRAILYTLLLMGAALFYMFLRICDLILDCSDGETFFKLNYAAMFLLTDTMMTERGLPFLGHLRKCGFLILWYAVSIYYIALNICFNSNPSLHCMLQSELSRWSKFITMS